MLNISRLTQTRCYGRWDTPQHVLIDDEFTEPDGPNGPVWRGKDYANERVMEYTNLDKPFEDMFDRMKVPRMPWYVRSIGFIGLLSFIFF